MSYTLRGRLESRLVAALLPLLAGCGLGAALPAWWPVELAALMIGVGLALDAVAYDRFLEYQAGWIALPLGLVELGLIMALVRVLGIGAPLGAALAFFAGAWTVAQVLGHAGFPLLRLSYAEDGCELGRIGVGAAAVTLCVLGSAGGLAWSKLPPTVHLSAGIHPGPLVINRRENLVGERGAVVRGGIVVNASHVTVRNVSIVGGENGIDVEEARDVLLDRVNVVGATLDGIHVRRSRVTIRDCTISSPGGYTQGIDISFSADMGMSMVEGCTVVGGRQGIVVDSALVTLHGNHVSATALQAIAMTEMSMGMIEQNEVAGALGAGIVCDDRSVADGLQQGYAIESNFKASAHLKDNDLVGNAGREAAFGGAEIVHR